MIKQVPAVALTALALGLAPLAAPLTGAQAATAPATSKTLPNPCKTFTDKSADAVFKISSHARLPEKLGSSHNPYARLCTVRHGSTKLTVSASRREGGTGSEENCYARPKLGPDGMVCVSNTHTTAFSFALYRKDGVWVGDGVNLRLHFKGKRIYEFALAQYKTFKG
jgi:hypothetical protein